MVVHQLLNARPECQPESRTVRFVVVGSMKSKVLVDGELHEWFEELTLKTGPHSVRFVPPDDLCCVAPEERVVQITPGTTWQYVKGKVAFRPSRLELLQQTGSRADCDGLGEMEPGQERAWSPRRSIPNPSNVACGRARKIRRLRRSSFAPDREG